MWSPWGLVTLHIYEEIWTEKDAPLGKRGADYLEYTGIYWNILVPGRKAEELVWEDQAGLKGHFRRQLSGSVGVSRPPVLY